MSEDQGTTPRLAGRTALVTGAAARIGRRLALALAREGARVAVHYHGSEREAAGVVTEILAMGGDAASLGGDLTDPEVAAGLVARAAAALGPVDILVNNASLFAPGDVLDTSLAQWDANLAIHATAPMLLSQALARQLPAGRDGVIVNLNDWRAGRPGPDHFAYTISKVALHGLTASLAQALGPRGIRVCELALGAVLPPVATDDGYLKTLRDDIPTRRFPRVDDVAAALVFLVCTPSLSGVTLPIDGGRGLV
jgi:NAD(P)-dependent dehydrogenase (short-subunit alcohol dehydrogenase family)